MAAPSGVKNLDKYQRSFVVYSLDDSAPALGLLFGVNIRSSWKTFSSA